MNMGDSRVLHLCVENDALVTNGLTVANAYSSKWGGGDLTVNKGS